MRNLAITLGAALFALSTGAAAQVVQTDTGGSDEIGSHIDRSRENKMVVRSVARNQIDDTVERMFKTADANRDGTVTLAEFNSVIDARKDRIIAERFARIDSDRSQSISMAEFAAWQRSIGSVALSDRLDTPQTGVVAENLPIEYGRKDDVDFMSLVVEPLNATMIVSANADYDTGTTLAELLDYEHARFDKADTNKDGFITWDEADALRKNR